MAKSATLADLTAVTHKRSAGDDEDLEAPDTPTMSAAERKVHILLIGTVRPGLAKKLLDGTNKLSDAKLLKDVPPHCDRCGRLGPPPKPCDQCRQAKEDYQASLADPENEDDPASPPKPTPDPFKQAKHLTTNLATFFTNFAAENGDLYQAFVACGLMDHPPGKTPRFLPLAGVSRVVSEVSRGVTDLEKIKLTYQEACGTWIPEMTRYWRERKGKR